MCSKVTILIWIFILCEVSLILGFRKCELSLYTICSDSEYCDEDIKQCQCLKGYVRINNTFCIPAPKTDGFTKPEHSSIDENGDGISVTTYILTPLFLIAFVISGIYLNKKYHLGTLIRNKFQRNSQNYDEFMIGQDLDDDDPPLH